MISDWEITDGVFTGINYILQPIQCVEGKILENSKSIAYEDYTSSLNKVKKGHE